MTHEWLVVFLVSVDIQDTNNAQINESTKKVLTDKFNTEIIEKLNGVGVDNTIRLVLINNIKLISPTEIKYNTDCYELVRETLMPFNTKLPNAFQLQDKESLLLLLKYLQGNFKSNRVMISTYGHGSMFGIFTTHNFKNTPGFKNFTVLEKKDLDYWNVISPSLMEEASANIDGEEIDYLLAARQFSSDKYLYKKTNILESAEIIVEPGIQGEFQKFKVLTNEEFAWAINESFGEIDFLIFNNCVMQNIYAQHSFKNAVKYLVAPVTGIVYPCFNVKAIINFLKSNTSKENSVISQFIVDSFKEEHNEDYEKYQNIIEEFIVVSMRLDNLKDIFDLLEKLKDYLKLQLEGQNKNEFACAIANSLEETYPMEYNTFTGETIFDLLQLLESDYLKDDEELQKFKQSFLQIISGNDKFIYTFTGNTAYNAGYKNYYTSKPNIIVSGFCLYFPKNRNQNSVIKPYFNSISYESDLEKGLKWYDDVIEKYLTIMNS